MIENVELVRWREVERRNGFVRTWWRYNRLTLVVALSAVLTLLVINQAERQRRHEAEANARALARATLSLACYDVDRPTSFLIVGGSRRVVYDALMATAVSADQLRAAWLLARVRAEKEAATLPSPRSGP